MAEERESFLYISSKTLLIQRYNMEGWSGSRLNDVNGIEAITLLIQSGYRYHSVSINPDGFWVQFIPPGEDSTPPKRTPMFKSEKF